jgi:serine protease AprX
MPELIPGTPLKTASSCTWNIKRIRAPEVWQMGYDGSGVVVGILDSGVDITHPDLAGKYRGGNNSWFDPFGEHDQPVKRKHGTHVAGIILGGNASGKHIGVAPGAQFIAAKLNNDAGDSSDPLRVFQWFMDPDGNQETDDAPDVINNSWHTYGFYNVLKICNDYYKDAIQALRTVGIVPVFSASNGGPLPFTGTSPAITPGAIVVGATNFVDGIGLPSSRGPNICDLSIYPDVCAPGVPIFSSFPDGKYRYYSGTSMAAPHVTGVIALMLDANPNLSVDEIESVLKETAKPTGLFHPNNSAGWGRVDALKAVEAIIP